MDERELIDCNCSEMGHLSEKVGRLLQPVGQRGRKQREAASQGEEGEWSLRQQVHVCCSVSVCMCWWTCGCAYHKYICTYTWNLEVRYYSAVHSYVHTYVSIILRTVPVAYDNALLPVSLGCGPAAGLE